MSPNLSGQRRAFFHLRYPKAEGPRADISGRKHEVTELSEGGARIHLPGDWSSALGRPIAGMIEFPDGEVVPVEGIVLRIHGPEVVIQFSQGVSFRRMLSEQSRVLRAYPHLFDHQPPGSSHGLK